MEADFAIRLGERIRQARQAQAMSQRNLAKRLGCSPTSVVFWEQGQRTVSVYRLVELAHVLRVPVTKLLPEWKLVD